VGLARGAGEWEHPRKVKRAVEAERDAEAVTQRGIRGLCWCVGGVGVVGVGRKSRRAPTARLRTWVVVLCGLGIADM